MKKEKYLLLFLKTGGGHLAPAKSVASRITELNNNIEPVLVDGFEKAPPLLKAIIEDGYRKLQYKTKWFYELLYAINKIKFIAAINAGIISYNVKDYLREVIEKEQPTKIIIFHFFLIKPVISLMAEKQNNIKIFIVVTDPFTAHPLWFHYNKEHFIVFSNQLKNYCIKKGVEEERIKVFNFILGEKFSTHPDNNQINNLKEKFSVKKNNDVILILGGGDGIPNGKKILKLLLEKHKDKEIIIICGKNKSLFNFAQKIKSDNNFETLKIFGYVDIVYELINISDIVITKCGASTFMEILISRKVPIVTTYIWEQEKGNKEFIVNNGLGIYVKNINNLPDLVDLVFRNIIYYRNNIEKVNIKNGAAEVSEYLINI
jgi:UDP-N-acetylglucosamine:LPS N-acetylglucosamine transferase